MKKRPFFAKIVLSFTFYLWPISFSVGAEDCEPVSAFCVVFNLSKEICIAEPIQREISGPYWLYTFKVTEILKGNATQIFQAKALRNPAGTCFKEIDLDIGQRYLVCIGRYKDSKWILGEKYGARLVSKVEKDINLLRELRKQEKTIITPCPDI